jgi:hypothetical protein
LTEASQTYAAKSVPATNMIFAAIIEAKAGESANFSAIVTAKDLSN